MWTKLPAAPIRTAPDWGAVSVWTGHEMIIHGLTVRIHGSGGWRGVTFAYRPATNRWVRLASLSSGSAYETDDVAVWTGSRMFVFGQTEASYNPATNTWHKLAWPGMSMSGAVTGWTGHRFLAWGGTCCSGLSHDGAIYNPGTDRWRKLPTAPIAPRKYAAGAWTGKELIVAGGHRYLARQPYTKEFRSGAAYNPATHTWRTLPPMPHRPVDGPALWDGKEVLFLSTTSARGMAFNPATRHWRLLPAMPLPRSGFAAVWTGHRVLVWGGLSTDGTPPPHGEAYIPATNRWGALPASPLPGRAGPTSVWTGDKMIVWGGSIDNGRTITRFKDGAAYTPRRP
jgi:N-acetylneuraminic acid mutarotase